MGAGAALLYECVLVRAPAHAWFFVINAAALYTFRGYLGQPSKYYDQDPATSPRRPWTHILVTTSATYGIAGVYAATCGQAHFAFLCLVTWVSSSLYHRHCEAKYFNVDNVFATSLLVAFAWSMYLAYPFSPAYFAFGTVGVPVAAFLLVYCGMPADIVPAVGSTPASAFVVDMLCCFKRQDRPLYNAVHALWHLASGVGPVASVWLFHRVALSNGDLTYVMGLPPTHTLDPWHTLPLVPSVALLVGVVINVCGNVAGIMPLD